jgi:hypothetical protein
MLLLHSDLFNFHKEKSVNLPSQKCNYTNTTAFPLENKAHTLTAAVLCIGVSLLVALGFTTEEAALTAGMMLLITLSGVLINIFGRLSQGDDAYGRIISNIGGICLATISSVHVAAYHNKPSFVEFIHQITL